LFLLAFAELNFLRIIIVLLPKIKGRCDFSKTKKISNLTTSNFGFSQDGTVLKKWRFHDF